MDSYGLINIILISVIYSTLIAPSLNKLASYRDEIAEIVFPKIDDSFPDEELQKIGDILEKRLSLYSIKYGSIKQLLKYFNWIILVLVLSQFYVGMNNNEFKLVDGWPSNETAVFIVIIVAVILLNKAIKRFMLTPNTVRSINWLTDRAGLRPAYYRKLIDAKLTTIIRSGVEADNSFNVEFSLQMRREFVGYRYIFLVESEEGNRCYHISTGPIGKSNPGFTWFIEDGTLEIASRFSFLQMRPGKYVARLLIFDCPFLNIGNISPVQLVRKLEIKSEGNAFVNHKQIDFTQKARSVLYRGYGLKIKEISYLSQDQANSVLSDFIENKDFIKLFKKCKRPFTASSVNGTIDKLKISKLFKKRQTSIRRIRRLFLRGDDRKYVDLSL